ncbi:MAG: SOS response-associated peptidase [Myxococcota bacterium]
MCGRMVLTRSADEIADAFEASSDLAIAQLAARYNVAPGQTIVAVRMEANKGRRLVDLYWGLIPFWAKQRESLKPMINARSETAASKPTFRAAMTQRRCLVPIDGFYEWQRAGSRNGQAKGGRIPAVPHYFRASDRRILAVAGLWESWTDRQTGEVLESCALLTTQANEVVGAIHHRMPVLLTSRDWELWLDPGCQDSDRVIPLLGPAAPGALEVVRVGTYVNDARHEDSRCIEPVE